MQPASPPCYHAGDGADVAGTVAGDEGAGERTGRRSSRTASAGSARSTPRSLKLTVPVRGGSDDPLLTGTESGQADATSRSIQAPAVRTRTGNGVVSGRSASQN